MVRWVLGSVFLAGYGLSAVVGGQAWEWLFVGTGMVLYALSVPGANSFHRVFAAVALATLGGALLTGKFDGGEFVEELPTYLSIVAVLLVLSVAGYPIRAARYEEQIQTLLATLVRRGVAVRSAAGGLGHLLGLVLDVGSFVLIEVVTRRAVPAARIDSLAWAARTFTFVPLWSNLNMLTVTTIALVGLSYPQLLAATAPFVVPAIACALLVAQREKEPQIVPAAASLDRGAGAVLAYPALLISAVAVVSYLTPTAPLTTVIVVVVTSVVLLMAIVAVLLSRRRSPLLRLASEARQTLMSSRAEFALFGSAGIFVTSLTQLGALAPIGALFNALELPLLVAGALFLAIAAGFMLGIHSIPMVLLIDAAFPLGQTSTPALWALAVLLGNGAGMLMTPFSAATSMLARLTTIHPLKVGPGRNWKFALAFAAAGLTYLVAFGLLL